MGGSGQGENVDSASFNTRCGCSALNLRKAFEFVWRLFFFKKLTAREVTSSEGEKNGNINQICAKCGFLEILPTSPHHFPENSSWCFPYLLHAENAVFVSFHHLKF